MRGMMKFSGLVAVGYFGYVAMASAVAVSEPVTCGDSNLGDRVVVITNGKGDDGTAPDETGLCYAQNGNFNGDDFSGVDPALELIDKNNILGIINYPGGATSGDWAFDGSLWDDYDRMFLAFHFGGGGECPLDASETNNPNDVSAGPGCLEDPDSFLVELFYGDSSGTWELTGPEGVKLNGLSNIYLLGICTEGPGNCEPPFDVPEPGTLGLLGFGLAGIGVALRRRRKI